MKTLTEKQINSVVDASFDKAFADLSENLRNELFPGAFANAYSWLRVKNSLEINNNHLKEALKQSLKELLID